MKNLKVSLMALALTIGVASALITKASNYTTEKPPMYNWQETDSSDQIIINGRFFQGSVPDAKTYFGCSGTAAACARVVDHFNGTAQYNPEISINHN